MAKDMTVQDQLEALIDKHGVGKVLDDLADQRSQGQGHKMTITGKVKGHGPAWDTGRRWFSVRRPDGSVSVPIVCDTAPEVGADVTVTGCPSTSYGAIILEATTIKVTRKGYKG